METIDQQTIQSSGMNLRQDDPISLDIRDIMSSQLTEIRMMREELKESGSRSAFSGTLPITENPYAMNSFYTEHHDAMINEAYANVSSDYGSIPADGGVPVGSFDTLSEYSNQAYFGQEASYNRILPEEGSSLSFSALSEYANQTGYIDLIKGGRIIDGQGYTAKQMELAKMQLGDQIVNDTLEKVDGAVKFGANVGGDMIGGAIGSVLGGPVGALIGGYAVGAISEYGAEKAIGYVQNYQDFKNRLYMESGKFINDFETEGPGSGFSKKDAKKLAREISGMGADLDISASEMAEIFNGAMDNDLMSTTSSVEEFSARLEKLGKSVKSVAKTLGKSFSEVTELMGQMQREGVDLDTADLLLSTTGATAEMLGMDKADFAVMLSQMAGGSTKGTAGSAGEAALGYSRLMGTLAEGKAMIEETPEEQRSYVDQALFNMNENDMLSLLSAQGQDQAHANIMDALMGASTVRKGTSSLGIDEERFLSLQDQLRSGEISMQDVQNMHQEKIAEFGGAQKFLPAFEVASGAFEASNPDLYANAGFAGMQARVYEHLKTEGISIEEYEQMNADDQSQYWAAAAMTAGYTATQGLQLYGLSNIATAENFSDEGFRQLIQRGVDEAKSDSWLFGDYNVPEYLKDPKVDELYDYNDLKGMDTYDAVRFQKQREQVANTFLFGVLDGETANEYQNKLSLNNLLSSPTSNAESDMKIVGQALMTEDVDRMALALKSAGMDDIAAELRKAREEGASQQVFTELGIKAVERTEEGIKKNSGKNTESAEKVGDMQKTVDENTSALEELIEVIKEGFEKNTDQTTKAVKFFNFGLF